MTRPPSLGWLIVVVGFAVGAFWCWNLAADLRAATRILQTARCVFYQPDTLKVAQ